MARKRKDNAKSTSHDDDGGSGGVKLRQPDRSAPTEATLLQLAEDRGLFEQAERDPRNKNKGKGKKKAAAGRQSRAGDDDQEQGQGVVLPAAAERLMEAILWTISLAMLHFTLDVLVQNQYAMEIKWPSIVTRTVQAFLIFLLLFYPLHPHASNPTLLPGLPARYQHPLRQAIFFGTSVVAGCYLIYVTNRHGYLAVMKRAPTLGCLWVWSVMELDLLPSVASLACAGAFLWQGGYSIR